jgi:uncharacterized protein VirK/YbjX
MRRNTIASNITEALRHLSSKPGLVNIKYTFRNIQALLHYPGFKQMKQLNNRLTLTQVLESQPRFSYKYLGHYATASFSKKKRLAAILNHYHFLASVVRPDFFTKVANSPVIWQETHDEDVFTISLSYPGLAHFEGELSLSIAINSTVVQRITFVIVTGELVGVAVKQTLLITQVQGTKHFDLMKYTAKKLHDVTPAVLLINAAYGLASALRLTHATGVSTDEQLCRGGKHFFNYDSFWEQLGGERTDNNLFLLDINTPEKPISSIKSNHRTRTLRKRQYKQLIRTTVAQYFEEAFLKS